MWIHIVVWIGLAAAAWLLRKKRSKWNVAILSLIAAGNLVGNILSFQEYQTSRETDRRVERNEDSDMTYVRKYRVSVEGESEEWKVQLEIPDRIYTEEESEQIFGEAMEKLDTVILGENESFDNISRKMELVTALPDCPVKIEWNTSEPVMLDWEGNPGDNIPEHGCKVVLDALLKLGDYTKEYVRLVKVYPEEVSGEKQFQRQMQEAVEEDNEDPRYVTLPEYWEGRKLTWKESSGHTGVMILALAAVAAALLGMKKKQDEALEREAREEQMTLDYPELVSKMILLLGAGLSTRRVFERIAADYTSQQKEPKARRRFAYEEAVHTYYEMEGGIPESQAYENFGKRCAVPAYRSLSVLLVQNLKKGNSCLLPLLEKEAQDAFEDRRRAAKIAGERASTKLLLPMAMTLGVVLTIIIVPAFIGFY